MPDPFRKTSSWFETPTSYPANILTFPGIRQVFLKGVPFNGKGTRFFACYSLPEGASAKKPVPGVVLIHGGGATALAHWCKLWNDRGYAAISMDTRGRIPCWAPNPFNHPWPVHEWAGPCDHPGFDKAFEKPDQQWAFHAVAAIVLSHSFLRSIPEIDPEGIGVSGISWGGVLACIAAAVDPRFKFAIPVYGGGFWTDTESSLIISARKNELEKWASLWDPKHYLPKLKMPFFILAGTNDLPFPANTFFKTLVALSCEKRGLIRTDLVHDHGACWTEETIFNFADSVIEGKPIPDPGKTVLKKAILSAPFFSERNIRCATLCFTRAEGFWADRVWHELPAEIGNNMVKAPLPFRTTAAYFNLYDDKSCAYSSTFWTK